jgi:hypothetical protein
MLTGNKSEKEHRLIKKNHVNIIKLFQFFRLPRLLRKYKNYHEAKFKVCMFMKSRQKYTESNSYIATVTVQTKIETVKSFLIPAQKKYFKWLNFYCLQKK